MPRMDEQEGISLDDFQGLVDVMVDNLLHMSLNLLEENGNFLPHGAAITTDGEFTFVAAAPEGPDLTTSVVVLPALHDGLRQAVLDSQACVVATAERVTFSVEQGGEMQHTVKILVEHVQPDILAVYVPIKKTVSKGYEQDGPVTETRPEPEIVPEWFEDQ
jgi:hypothetical protein